MSEAWGETLEREDKRRREKWCEVKWSEEKWREEKWREVKRRKERKREVMWSEEKWREEKRRQEKNDRRFWIMNKIQNSSDGKNTEQKKIKVVYVLFDHINEAIICDENQI